MLKDRNEHITPPSGYMFYCMFSWKGMKRELSNDLNHNAFYLVSFDIFLIIIPHHLYCTTVLQLCVRAIVDSNKLLHSQNYFGRKSELGSYVGKLRKAYAQAKTDSMAFIDEIMGLLSTGVTPSASECDASDLGKKLVKLEISDISSIFKF